MKMANLVRAAAGDLIRDFLADKPIPSGQQQTGAATSHCSRDPRVNHLVWSDPRERIRNIVRALAPPLPGAFILIGETPVTLTRVDAAESPASALPRTPGMVEIRGTGSPIVWTGDGPIELKEVLVEGNARPASALVEAGVLTEGQVLS
jgi:methionyl-tRNA formyltransferase